ncbi:Peptidase S10 [Theobroma cacao]|uniref:Carboxypeptidase n=1 Tax=Theobroma cacao TaxID=3641 RepID=A0A061EVR5_THECC|nr:Serine carboxypeptidase 45 [Theobroma cacao]WRX23907.1 Peptidase S10 [Theobroma cacao]
MKSGKWIAFVTLVHACLTVVESLPKADKIVALPGQPRANFQQFSGYLTVDEKQKRALFYYFVEAETMPASKPLVLWLNGGPGCSSIGAGALTEHGPFKPNGETMEKNKYSWNKEANMLYLESPAGVGFSYSANNSFYANLNDEVAARDNLVFLERWFVKFPEYKNRDFYITGESYAGHYVPQLAQLIIHSNLKLNLKGIAIGNPLLEFATDMNSVDQYYWSHGLISDSAYELLTSFCNSSRLMREVIRRSISSDCISVYSEVSTELTKSIDQYDVIADVCLSSGQSPMAILSHSLLSGPQHSSQADGLSQQQVSVKEDPCIQDKTTKYLNRKDVQKALHAQLVGTTSWNLCNKFVQYMDNLETPTIHIVGSIVKSGIPVMVYSGDQDSVIPFTGTRTLVYKLAKALGLNTTVPYRPWFEGKQVGGWTQVYGDILSFATIRGASHTAPASQPERSLALFKAVLAGKPLPEA